MGIFKKRKKGVLQHKPNDELIRAFYGDNFNLMVYRYARSIYSIPEVRTAIEAVTDIFSGIPIYHKIIEKNESTKYLTDDVEFILNTKPNKLQNGVQFWKTVITQYLLENNVFIEPIYSAQNGKLKSLYTLPFKVFDFELQQNKAYVRFYDNPNGNIVEKHDIDNLIYLSRFSSLTGGAKTDLGLYETVIQALSNQILNITDPKKVKAILQGTPGYTPNIRPEDRKGEMNDLKISFDQNVNGIAYVNPQWRITAVNWQENDVNRDLMKFVINVVYNYFKITEDIINNKASEIEREMFIAQTIRPIAMQLEQELTYKLFTDKEIKEGHRIEFDVFALSINTLNAKTQLFNIAARNGILNIDEMREYLGQPKLPNGLGQMYRVTGDTMNLENVDIFQSAQKGVTDFDDGENIESNKKEEDSG